MSRLQVEIIGILTCLELLRILYSFNSFFTYIPLLMKMLSQYCLICSPTNNFNSSTILISNSLLMNFENSLHEGPLLAPNNISSIQYLDKQKVFSLCFNEKGLINLSSFEIILKQTFFPFVLMNKLLSICPLLKYFREKFVKPLISYCKRLFQST